MADLRARSSAHSPADSGVSFSRTASASAAAPSGVKADLLDRCDQLSEQLQAVRDYLALLADCFAANTDSSTDLDAECLAVSLGNLANELAQTAPAFETLSDLTKKSKPKLHHAIEDQGNAVCAVRHMLRTLYGALGNLPRHHQFNSETIGATMSRLAARIGAADATLMTLAYANKVVASPPPPAAPAAAAAALTAPAPQPMAPRKSRIPARAARAVRPSKGAAACV